LPPIPPALSDSRGQILDHGGCSSSSTFIKTDRSSHALANTIIKFSSPINHFASVLLLFTTTFLKSVKQLTETISNNLKSQRISPVCLSLCNIYIRIYIYTHITYTADSKVSYAHQCCIYLIKNVKKL